VAAVIDELSILRDCICDAWEQEQNGSLATMHAINRALDRLINKSLSTDPDERWQTARDLASELKWIAETVDGAPATMIRAEAYTPGWWIASTVAAMAMVALPAFLWLRPTPEQTEIRVQMASTGGSITEVALSPDGQSLAYVWVAEGARQPRLRRLDSGIARTLDGTDGAKDPFWSPDNRSIGFYARGQLKRLDTIGGSPVDLARGLGFGGSWNQASRPRFSARRPAFPVSRNGRWSTRGVPGLARLERDASTVRQQLDADRGRA